jgi:hypothetical protein
MVMMLIDDIRVYQLPETCITQRFSTHWKAFEAQIAESKMLLALV